MYVIPNTPNGERASDRVGWREIPAGAEIEPAASPARDAWVDGCQAISAGDVDVAIVCFARASLLARENRDPIEAYARSAESLALRLRDLTLQREYLRRSHEEVERSLRQAKAELHDVLALVKAEAPSSMLDRLVHLTRPRVLVAEPIVRSAAGAPHEPHHPAVPGDFAPPGGATAGKQLELPLDLTPSAARPATPVNMAAIETPRSQDVMDVRVQVLGAMRVTIDGQDVTRQISSRGRAVFAYLLAQQRAPVPREVLMDVFWPDSMPKAARNSLNVALHSLRSALTMLGRPIVVFAAGAYQLSDAVEIRSDIDAFLAHTRAGRQHETSGQLDGAVVEYEQAVAAYTGDFVADSPYEEWTHAIRQKISVTYLDVLDRLSSIYFGWAQYAACGALCQLILAQDGVREDVHVRLMYACARQGHFHLALRQYHACVDALQRDLNVMPAAKTTELYERIRRHEAV